MEEKVSESNNSTVSVPKVLFGHEFTIKYSVQKLVAEQVQKMLDPICHNVPTSWLLEMGILEHPITQEVTFPVKMMRVDYMDTPVDALISVKVYDNEGRVLWDASRPFHQNKMLKGDEIFGNFLGPPASEMADIFKHQIFISFTVKILNCHSEESEDSRTSEIMM